MPEDAEIDDGIFGTQFHHHEEDEADNGDNGEPRNEARFEPIFPLAPVQDKLEASEPYHKKSQTLRIDRAYLRSLQVWRIDDRDLGENDTQYAEGNVYTEDPTDQLSVIQPPTRGPMIGPAVTPMPNTAMAVPI